MKTGILNLEGQSLSYQHQKSEGDKTIVLLHGNSSCKAVFEPQFKYFKDSEFSLLAIDLPGHGGSENAPTPEQNYTIPGYAQLIDKAIKRLGIGDYILVGWSLGGNIALELAGCDHAQANPKLKAIMIFGAPPVGPGMDNIMEAFLPATFEHAVGQADASADEIKAWVKVVYGTLDPIPPQFLKCTLRTDGIAREIMFTHWASGESGYKQIETVVSWQKPICVLHGSQDAFASLDYLKLAPWNNLWRDKIWEMPECGHAPFVENPTGFNAVLEKFVTDVL